MKRYTVTLGASTTAGGKVISASSGGCINGVRIALENDAIFCPACKSKGKIVCVGARLPESWDGKQVALEKDICLCGCFPSPRLLANQSLRCQNVGTSNAVNGVPAGSPMTLSVPPAELRAEGYDLDFLVTDAQTGAVLVEWPYTLELASGAHLEGKTDRDGKTVKIAAAEAEHAVLRIYAPATAPINPYWDR